MNQKILEQRLIQYAKRCLLLGRDLYDLGFIDSKHLASQLIRSGSHPGIHYGEARAAQSRRDYIHKLSVLLKELRDGEKINLFSFDFAFCAKTRNTWTRRAQKGKSSEKENRFISVKLLRESHNTIVIADMMEYYESEKLSTLLSEGNELIATFTTTFKKLKENEKV